MTEQRGQALLRALHDRVPKGPVVTYPPKAGFEQQAAREWKWTGVCPKCHRRAISAAECKACGWRGAA